MVQMSIPTIGTLAGVAFGAYFSRIGHDRSRDREEKLRAFTRLQGIQGELPYAIFKRMEALIHVTGYDIYISQRVPASIGKAGEYAADWARQYEKRLGEERELRREMAEALATVRVLFKTNDVIENSIARLRAPKDDPTNGFAENAYGYEGKELDRWLDGKLNEFRDWVAKEYDDPLAVIERQILAELRPQRRSILRRFPWGARRRATSRPTDSG